MYRTIDSQIWIDPKVKGLKSEVKLIWLYLLTNSHTHVSGIYHLPFLYACHELGMSEKTVVAGMNELEKQGMIHYDPLYEVVFVVKFLGYQSKLETANVKIITAVKKQLTLFKDSSVVLDFLRIYDSIEWGIEGVSKGYQYPTDTFTVLLPVTDTCSVPDKKDKKVNNKRSKEDMSLFPSQFDRFWKAYPSCQRKTNKQYCLQIWEKGDYDDHIEWIVKTLARTKQTIGWVKDNGDDIPMPSTWLNQRRWADNDEDLEAIKVTSSSPQFDKKGKVKFESDTVEEGEGLPF